MSLSPDPAASAPSLIAATPDPPYFAVIFTSTRVEGEDDGGAAYAQTASEMERLAAAQPGFLGVESSRGADGLGITVSYWSSLDAIAGWKQHGDHLTAQRAGRARWYRAYALRLCRVERASFFEREPG